MPRRPRNPPDSTELAPFGELVFAELVDDDDPGPQQGEQAPRTAPNTPRLRQLRAAARRVAHCARTAACAIAGHVLPGLRHALSAARHWLRAGYMSDDEIRRRIINKPLEADLARRHEARTAVRRLENRMRHRLEDAAAYGLDASEKQTIRNLSLELRRRRNGLAALQSVPFTAEQPTDEQIRRARSLRAFGRFSTLVPILGAAGAVAASAPSSLLGAAPLLAAGGWWLTYHPLELVERPIPEDLLLPELAPPALESTVTSGTPGGNDPQEDLTPFPIAQATTPEEAGEALRRALLHERQDVDQVTEVTKEAWGWSARATFNTGTPDDLNKDDTYKGLITLLRLRRNGLLIEGDPDAGEACTVRMMQRSPFSPELVGDVPYRAPLSMSITEPADYGVSMDAKPLFFALAGLMLLMVADSGAGKSGVMLAMAEVVTACRDAAAFNLDPVGTGVGDLGEAITLNACMDDEKIVATLQFLLTLCSARARLRARYGWGNKWRVSPEHPAIVVFVDEWAQLSAQAKALLIRLLLVGRKEAIWVIGGSQFGTKDWLGEAVGPKLSGKLLGSCRRVDVTELLGGGALAEGYRADLLRAATHTEVNDAGQLYAQGLPGVPDRPVRYKVREVTAAYAAQIGAERAAAGLPDLTYTLTEAGLVDEWQGLIDFLAADAPAEGQHRSVGLPDFVRVLREAFTREKDPAFLTYDQLHPHLRAHDADRWGRWDDKSDIDRIRELGKAVRRELDAAQVELSSERIRELDGAPRGFYLSALEEAVEDLR
ncbi:hypothetical protein OG413_44915 [Streptomyces sp. NBC_01433]|uniref:hypothetical protein n=1 Tax=Streptomyces sp. NBC_01433 TaxID=2903864 RepID=UPI0022548D6D|nr:hypothetical protein [Streptomyces sp. NBC_01433]MCX4682328.1 hypothetical protein [Streptomyces sp. NBC_01433]